MNRILRAFESEEDFLGNFTDEFRSGRNPKILLKLIESDKDKLIEIGIFVINEITIKSPKLRTKLKVELVKLTSHVNSSIRAQTFFILSQMFKDDGESDKVTNLHLHMLKDEDIHIQSAGKKLLKDGHMY